MTDSAEGFAAWHPTHGFNVPHHYEGGIAFVRIDDVIQCVKDLNRDAGTTNRTGWRVVPVTIARRPS